MLTDGDAPRRPVSSGDGEEEGISTSDSDLFGLRILKTDLYHKLLQYAPRESLKQLQYWNANRAVPRTPRDQHSPIKIPVRDSTQLVGTEDFQLSTVLRAMAPDSWC
ncbi:unnamed protein product [Toxocara canis]|uniref:Uncharacterized protein n=1 Tax=Toxocara canis TaxID=6265 RepID=A0A183TWG5_TOXCA|nr:unnamed protein product [Toxocara canis]